jgi:hypothetical protein
MNVQLPAKKGQPNTNPTIDIHQLVVIGANGSGKTRFGSNIERRYNQKAHRISAQKSLSIPKYISPKERQVAESEFLNGIWVPRRPRYDLDAANTAKISNRWGNRMDTFPLDDYEKLLVLLHSEEYEQALNYKAGGDKPITKLDRIQNIWETVLPHRKLRRKAGVIEA